MASPLPPQAGRDEIEHWLSSTRDRMEERGQAAENAANVLTDLTVSAESDDGAVRATVTSSGALRELTLGETARGWEPRRIAQQVLECVQRAQAGLADATQDSLATAPGGLELAGLVADQLRDSFPPLAPKTTTSNTASRRPLQDEVDDDVVPVILQRPTEG